MARLVRVLNSKGKRPPRLPSKKVLKATYASMARLRAIDEDVQALAARGRVTYYLPIEKWEAIAVGVAHSLNPGDWLFTRAQVPDGGGLDLTCGQDITLVNTNSPGSARLTHAMGVAWASKIRGDDAVACVTFGEALANQDGFHIALNFAGVHRLPVVFVCRSTGDYIDTAAETISGRGEAYDLKEMRVDGADVLAVMKAVGSAVKRARKGEGATLVEAIVPSDAPDPVMLLGAHLVQTHIWGAEDEEMLEKELAETRLRAAGAACAPATGSELFDHVMAHPSPLLIEQRTGQIPCVGVPE